MYNPNSDPASERSTQSLLLLSSLATGSGEAALKANPKIYPFVTLRQPQAPAPTAVSYFQPQFNYMQPVQKATTVENTHTGQIAVNDR